MDLGAELVPLRPPTPDPALELYQRVLIAVQSLQTALAHLTLPAPIVQVDRPDFEGLVQAMMGTRPELLDYDRLAQIVRDAIDVPTPQVTVQAPGPDTELQKTLEGLAFSLRGLGRMGSGGGSVSLQPGQTLQGINSPVTTSPLVQQTQMDYDVRTDSNPVYIGVAATGAQQTDTTWTVSKIAYDGSARITSIQHSTGAWSNRTNLTYS